MQEIPSLPKQLEPNHRTPKLKRAAHNHSKRGPNNNQMIRNKHFDLQTSGDLYRLRTGAENKPPNLLKPEHILPNA